MKFDHLLATFHEQLFFDLNTVNLFFDLESPSTIRTALHRFVRDGKVIALRRGLYTFGLQYQKKELSGPLVANLLYQPSYLSERWALGWYGIIPEKVVTYTNVTTRPTRNFSNRWGIFQYRTIARSTASGTIPTIVAGQEFRIAEQEQALLDFWYLEGGEWKPERMESMRFDPEPISIERLSNLADIFHSKTIDAAVHNWRVYSETYDSGVEIS